MISGYRLPLISYIGKNSDFSAFPDKIDSCRDFLEVIQKNINLNLNLDILITCLDISEFEFTEKFLSEVIDEESPAISDVIESLNSTIAKKNLRILFYVGKEFFLASQLDNVKSGTAVVLNKLSDTLDLLGVNYPSIAIRVGSAYGNRRNTMDSFCNRLDSLKGSTRSKLCVMNDDKPSLFSVTDLLSGIYYKTEIPICFRLLSHQFNDGGLSIREALFLSCSTWKKGQRPIFIHSESSEVDQFGVPVSNKPSGYLKHRIPTFGLDVDVIIDSPLKEDSCLKYRMDYKSLPPIVINKISGK